MRATPSPPLPAIAMTSDRRGAAVAEEAGIASVRVSMDQAPVGSAISTSSGSGDCPTLCMIVLGQISVQASPQEGP